MLKIKGFGSANKLYKNYYKNWHIYKKYKISYRYFKKATLQKLAECEKEITKQIRAFSVKWDSEEETPNLLKKGGKKNE